MPLRCRSRRESRRRQPDELRGVHPRHQSESAQRLSAGVGTTPAQDVTVQFQTIEGRTYSVAYSENLVDWSIAETGIEGDGSLLQWTDDGSQTNTHPATEPRRFYRIEVELPE